MSTHAAYKPLANYSTVKDMVDSLTEGASTVLANFDARSVQAKQHQPAPVVQEVFASTLNSAPWMPALPATPASHFRKSGMFVLVVLAHALAAYGLTRLPQQVESAVFQPLQVTIFQESHSEREQSLPPPPLLQQPNIVLPTEPVFLDIADPETTSITVTARPAEPATTSTAVGEPKVVSSVEYIREPHPKYPPAARALKQRGTVTLRVLVDAAGHAREVSLHRTSGYRVLDDAARKAVLEAQFKPYMENGHALAVYVFVPIEFGAA